MDDHCDRDVSERPPTFDPVWRVASSYRHILTIRLSKVTGWSQVNVLNTCVLVNTTHPGTMQF